LVWFGLVCFGLLCENQIKLIPSKYKSNPYTTNTIPILYTMSHIRKHLQSAIQTDANLEMDAYLEQSAENLRKSTLQRKISSLVNDPNVDDIIFQNKKNGTLYTQTILRNMTESNPIERSLKRQSSSKRNEHTLFDPNATKLI
jgi:hypothetical protein